jgi:hypothetical protein
MNRPFPGPGAALRKRWLTTRLLSAALVAATCLLALADSAAAAPRQPQTPCTSSVGFIHTATAANSNADYSDLNNLYTNGCPGMLVYVTPDFTPGTVWDTHPLGVWYNSWTSKWSIFHEDKTAVPLGATYNVTTFPFSNSAHFIQTATTTNSAGDETIIDNPVTNNQPTYQLIVTPNWSVGYVYDPHPLGVWYWAGHWIIFHEDGTPLPVGANYNVVVATLAFGHAYLQTARVDNSAGDWTAIDPLNVNNFPYVSVFGVYVTANWSGGGVFDPHVLGVWYQVWTGQWVIFHEDQTPIPLNATYNVYTSS